MYYCDLSGSFGVNICTSFRLVVCIIRGNFTTPLVDYDGGCFFAKNFPNHDMLCMYVYVLICMYVMYRGSSPVGDRYALAFER